MLNFYLLTISFFGVLFSFTVFFLPLIFLLSLLVLRYSVTMAQSYFASSLAASKLSAESPVVFHPEFIEVLPKEEFKMKRRLKLKTLKENARNSSWEEPEDLVSRDSHPGL